jgi:restriction endonuclease Mrr
MRITKFDQMKNEIQYFLTALGFVGYDETVRDVGETGRRGGDGGIEVQTFLSVA